MKQISYKLILVAILLFGSNSVNAQFLKELGERVKEKAKSRTEQKVDEKTDQAMDSLFVKRDKKESTKSEGEESNQPTSSSSKISMSGTFNYAFTATIEVDTYKKKKTEKNVIVQSYGDGSLLSTVEKSTVLHDLTNERVFLIDTVTKKAQVTSLKWFQKMRGADASNTEKDEDYEVIKTGRTQVLNGYTCHEYIITHEDGKVEAWYSPGVEFDYWDYMQGFSKMFGKKSPPVESGKGYVMKMITFDKSDKKVNSMEVTDLNETPRSISLSDYQVTKLF
ncbi:MAG: DUF4412 domain-containing protein [Crocinitomicaceae bacterium]|nr:DUF4412 domain-containing protein [Crocinitomicaceae bacterium]